MKSKIDDSVLYEIKSMASYHDERSHRVMYSWNSICPVPETPLEQSLRPGRTGSFSVALRGLLSGVYVDIHSVPVTVHGNSVTGTVLSLFVGMSHVGTPPSPSEAEGVYPLVTYSEAEASQWLKYALPIISRTRVPLARTPRLKLPNG
ncbi:hypothetical protein DFH28DRAFT_935987 [Melampsora americana]|nr:hypothetical protein DFH28DRAFT_935987 [Melampsora americana]